MLLKIFRSFFEFEIATKKIIKNVHRQSIFYFYFLCIGALLFFTIGFQFLFLFGYGRVIV